MKFPKLEKEFEFGWTQPDASRIRLENYKAYMTLETFNELTTNASIPETAYAGKMWKSGQILRWFAPHKNGDKNRYQLEQAPIVIKEGAFDEN